MRAAIEALAKRMDIPLEVKILERKGPLSSLAQPVGKLRNLRPGDAVIAFSRREVLAWRDEITAAGFSVSTLYGNLSPEVRRAQAQRFVDGESDIVVSTDVIGMGVNLPCARVVFSATSKFNGVEKVELAPAMAKQIAGRAGRYGQHEEGFYAGYDESTHRVLLALMKEKSAPVPTVGFMVSPSLDQLQTIAGATGEASLAKLLSLFEKNVDGNDGFFLPRITAEQAERAVWLDTLPLSLGDKFQLSLVPISTRFESLRRAWEGWCRALVRKMPCRLETKSFSRYSDLQEVEDTCKLYSAYAWLAYRRSEYFPDGEKAVHEARVTSDLIDDILRRHNAASKVTARHKSGARQQR
jgi:ATP-dependent RNA helicase SUPV3L1/SUV3